ncbi:37S ribosomal protein rsm22 [Purpureocillium lavendulum]|uniref:37S ribosomal protein rsm22 n=1 Tax=Purpureocillium lavendulum TaxID=1247861 RepID=A0AB34G5T4_9HYPO|nr:37S ribosomal protein rsm22 [Purpureocillium lavendulum]
MSIAIWPPVPAAELPALVAETRARELAWIVAETLDACRELKHGLDDCYALLAPVDPGSTLVMSTRHNEKVKGTLTRVGTRIVKGVRPPPPPLLLLLLLLDGFPSPRPFVADRRSHLPQTLHLQLRTLPAQTISVDPSSPIHIPALDELHTHLTQSIDLLSVCLSRADSSPSSSSALDAPSLHSTLALLADSLAASSALLKGPQQLAVPPSSTSSSSAATAAQPAPPQPPPDTSAWLTSSCPAHHFLTPCPSPHHLSVHLGLQESCVVLHLRALEPAGVPVHFGTKLGLAIGTVRRLEHDEMDTVFPYRPAGDGSAESKHPSARHSPDPSAHGSGGSGGGGSGSDGPVEQVYVREKVRIESADPSLISLYSKLGYLSHMLGQTRRNLAAVMDVDLDEA